MGTEIRLHDIVDNYRHLRQLVRGELTAVIKADAYGHGALKVYDALKGECSLFAVANVREGMELRAAGAQLRIMVLSDVVTEADWHLAVQHRLEPVIHTRRQIDYLEFENKPNCVWLKFDSGMHRAGLTREEVKVAYVTAQKNRVHIAALMSHLASSEDENADELTLYQCAQSEALALELNVPLSLANSAACLRFGTKWRHAHFRAGISLYGMSPIDNKIGTDLGLKPAMRVTSEVLSLKQLKSSEGVGYNHIWHASDARLIGLVPFGYADGYPRLLSGSDTLINASVFIERSGCYAPVVGRVSMDLITIDATNLDVKEGDIVEIWGNHIPLEQLAAKAKTISYEILTHAKLARRRGLQYQEGQSG